MSKNNSLSFTDKEARILAAYGGTVDFKSKDAKYLLLDLIELQEDILSLSKSLNRIIFTSCSKDKFKRHITLSFCNLWHTIEHMKRLDKAIKRISFINSSNK